MPRAKSDKTKKLEADTQMATIMKEKVEARKDELCTISNLSIDTIKNYDCSIFSIRVYEKCKPSIDYLKSLNKENIEMKKVKTGEYINIKLQNSWHQLLKELLYIVRAIEGHRFEAVLIKNRVSGKELTFGCSIYWGYQGGKPIYAEEFCKGKYLFCTYSTKVLLQAIKGLSNILNLNIEMSLIKLEEKQEGRIYQVGRLFMPIPHITQFKFMFSGGRWEGAMIMTTEELNYWIDSGIRANIILTHPYVNPRVAYEKIEKSTNKPYLLAYPLFNGHLDILKDELQYLNKTIFKEYTFADVTQEQFDKLCGTGEFLPKSILEEDEVVYLVFNAMLYYKNLYPEQTL